MLSDDSFLREGLDGAVVTQSVGEKPHAHGRDVFVAAETIAIPVRNFQTEAGRGRSSYSTVVNARAVLKPSANPREPLSCSRLKARLEQSKPAP